MKNNDEYFDSIEKRFITMPKTKKEKIWNNLFFFIVIILVIIETLFILYLNLTDNDLLYGLILFLICSTIIFMLFYIIKKYYMKKFYKVKDGYKYVNLIECNNDILDNMYKNATLVMIATSSKHYLNFIYNWLNNNRLINSNINIFCFKAKDLKEKYSFESLDDDTELLGFYLSDLLIDDDKFLNFRNELTMLGIRYFSDIIDNEK